MKSYTDLEQSKKLAEILPLESADMYFEPSAGFCTEPSEVRVGDIKYAHPRSIRCWSLAALLGVLPSSTLDSSNDHYYRLHCMERFTGLHENPIDACYEMIVGLHELNLL